MIMATHETVRHTARILDPWETTALDIKECSRLEICVTLIENETARHGFETWPPKVQTAIRDQAKSWKGKNPDAEIKCISTAYLHETNTCVLIIHYSLPSKE